MLHELFQEAGNLGGKRRKRLAKCRKPHDAIFTERTEDLLRRSRQRRLFPLFCLILDLDLQAALARHEEPHRLSGRAQVEVCDPTCRFQHLGRKPCLFVDNREDRLQLVTRPLPFILPNSNDEALDPASAERHEYAPARRKERQLVGHSIAVRLRYALHGNIDKDFRPSQNTLLP